MTATSYPGFAGAMRETTAPLWRAILAHPLVTAIGDGSLSADRFEFYLRQDYVYLVDFSRVLALAAAKAPDEETTAFFSSLLQTTIGVEMEIHRTTSAAFGIGARDLERTEPALVTAAYTSTLLRTAYEGTFGDITAALLPCAAGYVEIASQLEERGLPEEPHLRAWIEAYASPEMKEIAGRLVAIMDRCAESGSAADRERWHRLYRMSARFELLFFEMAWEKSHWPESVTA
jgi:thiaminase/transcriptional activator TenA